MATDIEFLNPFEFLLTKETKRSNQWRRFHRVDYKDKIRIYLFFRFFNMSTLIITLKPFLLQNKNIQKKPFLPN